MVSNPLSSSSPYGYFPSQIRTAYGINAIGLGSLVGDGSGQTIAIVDTYDDPNITSDLHSFDTQFGIADPPSFVKLNEYGQTSPLPSASGSSGWSVEESLDVEWAHALAPKANIILIEATSASDSDLMATVASSLATSPNLANVSVVSMSFGRSEYYSDTSENAYFTTPTGHIGITFVASTGDSGAPGGISRIFAQRRCGRRHLAEHRQQRQLSQRNGLERERRRAKQLRKRAKLPERGAEQRLAGSSGCFLRCRPVHGCGDLRFLRLWEFVPLDRGRRHERRGAVHLRFDCHWRPVAHFRGPAHHGWSIANITLALRRCILAISTTSSAGPTTVIRPVWATTW